MRFLWLFGLFLLLAPGLAQAQCSDPPGDAGHALYHDDFGVPQYCDGTNWIAMVGGQDAVSAPTNGLVGYWSMDTVSGTTVSDDSGNGNDGTWLSNDSPATVKTVPGIRGNAVSFDGDDDGIRIGQDPDFDMSGTNAFTISAWVKPNSTIGGNKAIFARGLIQTGETSTPYNFYHNTSGRWASQISDGTTIWGIYDYGFAPSIDYEQWVHLTITWDGTDHKIYKNGALISNENRPGFTLWDTASGVRQEVAIGAAIGSVSPSLSIINTFDGLIDEVYFYNRALSAEEAQSMYLAADHAMGYFVMIGNQPTNAEANEFDGDLGGISGANATCFSYLTTYNWLGKSIVEEFGYLTADNVRAWLCDDTTCNQLSTNTKYAVATTQVGKEYSGGATFIADGSGLYPASDSRLWSEENYFDRNTYFSTGRAADFSASGNSCSGWTSTSGNGERGGFTNNSDSQRWSGGTQSCAATDQFICIVDFNGVSKGSIRYKETQRAHEYFDGNRWVVMTAPWPDVTDGLALHLTMDEAEGTTMVDAVHGITFNIENTDADTAVTRGPVGNAFDFIRPDARLYAPNFLALEPLQSIFAGGGSVSFWVYPVEDDDVVFDLLSYNIRYRTGAANETGFWFVKPFSDSQAQWRTDDTTPDIPYNQWSHLALVYNQDDTANDPVLYINGIEAAPLPESTAPSGTALEPADGRMSIGAGIAGTGPIKGMVDDFRLYNRMLSASEISRLYQMGTLAGSSTALPQDCPSVGDVCDDGTIYAGLSSEDSVALFTTPEDGPDGLTWNDGNSDYAPTGTSDYDDGDGNTNTIVSTDSNSVAVNFQVHNAPQYCYDLAAHGADDWYLPAARELRDSLCSNQGVLPNLSVTGNNSSRYWSSTEKDTSQTENVRFDTCQFAGDLKDLVLRRIRCVRKGPAPRCVDPYGLEGAMLYNGDHNVMQYCDGARWLAIGKDRP